MKIGETLNKLTLIEVVKPPEHVKCKTEVYGKFACSCGAEKVILVRSVTTQHTKSCGCSKDKLINSQAFIDFTDENTAYFFGLLLADGMVSKDRNRITLGLKEQDKHIVEAFKNYLQTTNTISKRVKDGYVRFVLTVDSKTIKDRLTKQNLLPNKSTAEKLPNFNWKENRHFWRGVVDGDGSVFAKQSSPKISLCGSFELLSGFNDFCQLNCFTKPSTIYSTKSRNFYTICFSGQEALSVMNKLYLESNTYLHRKMQRVLEYNNTYTPTRTGNGINKRSESQFVVNIGFKGKRKYVGSYKTYEEALAARLLAEVKYQGKTINGSN